MKIMTARVQHHRDFKALTETHVFVDVTRKSGLGWLAPSKNTLYTYKYNGKDESAYRRAFHAEMRESFKTHRDEWLALAKEKRIVVLACYCDHDAFCHRKILVRYFKKVARKLGLSFKYLGEHRKEK